MTELPIELIDAAKRDNLILFTGAGLSFNFKNIDGEKLEGWVNLVKRILLFLKEKEYDITTLLNRIDQIEYAIANNEKPGEEPIDILKCIEQNRNYPTEELLQFVANLYFLASSEINDYAFHSNLFNLSKIIITTNYDNAFELSYPNLKTILIGKNSTLDDINDTFLFKLHGCINKPNSLVLFPSSYDHLYNRHILFNKRQEDAERIILSLSKLIISKNILFLGYGMGDYQVNNIFSNIKEILGNDHHKHFIILKEPISEEYEIKLKELNFLTPIKIKDYSEIKDIIQVLINAKNKSGNLEKQLKKRTEELNREEEPVKRLALISSISGLEFHIDKNYEKAIEYYQAAARSNPFDDSVFDNWGVALFDFARINNNKNAFKESLNKFQIATTLNSQNDMAFCNWGIALSGIAKLDENESLFEESFEKLQMAIFINQQNDSAYNNLGVALSDLAQLKQDISIFHKSFAAFEQAISINPNSDFTFNNWGIAFYCLAELQKDKYLYEKSFEKYKKAIDINPSNDYAFYNWGAALYGLGKLTKNSFIIEDSCAKYEKAAELNSNKSDIFNNWGLAISYLSKLKNDNNLLKESCVKYDIAIKINPSNDSAFYNWGISLFDLAKSEMNEEIFKESCVKYELSAKLNPQNDSTYYNWGTALLEFAKLNNNVSLFESSCEKFEMSATINPFDDNTFTNWGISLFNLGKTKGDSDSHNESVNKLLVAIDLNSKNDTAFYYLGLNFYSLAILKKDKNILLDSLKMLLKAYEIDKDYCYNVAYFYTIIGNKDNSLIYLKESLDTNMISVSEIFSDNIWSIYQNDDDFNSLLNEYK